MIKTNYTNLKMEHKIERRSSSTSESSVEPMDLGRTPKKLNINNESIINSNDSENYETENEEYLSSTNKNNLIRRDNLRRIDTNENTVEDVITTSPLSLRKKFRISSNKINNNNNLHNNNNNNNIINNKSNNDITQQSIGGGGDQTNNESGFVDTSSHQLNSSPESGISERGDDVKYVCPICEVVSATPHEFTNHIRCHNYSSGDTENFTCRICKKVLSSASSLDRHVLVHTGERPFNCKYCHLTFTTNGNMHRHMRTHKQHQQQRKSSGISGTGVSGIIDGSNIGNNGGNHSGADSTGSTGGGDGESYESDGCSTDSSASSSNNNNNNNNSHNNNNNIINNNNNNNINNNNNNNNNTNNNNNNYKRKSTDDDDNRIIKRRMKTINNNNNIIPENDIDCNLNHINSTSTSQKFCCPVCSRNDFINMLTLGTHMDREHPSISAKCRQCEIIFKSHKALNSHRCCNKLNITQGFKDITFVDFSSEKFPLIAKSLCEQTIRTPITNQKFECPKCYRAFPCSSAVDIHIKNCGEISSISPQDFSLHKRARSESSDEDNRRDEFFAHLDLQNKSAMSLTSTLSSPRTSEKSESKIDLEKIPTNDYHNDNHHHHGESKDLADIQSILNVTSSSSNSFLRNFENSVNAPNDYIYGKDEEEAQDAFTSEFRKMKLRGEFPCKLCTAVFPNLRALKGHNRIHLSAAGAGPYHCNMCPYLIHDKAALIRHMRTHNGDRPYECAVCNYAFTTKANCERHLRNRHAKTTRDEVKRAIIYHPSEDSSCEDPNKKLHLFSSPEFDQDDEHSAPKDRSTPVSHLKEILQSDKPVKIQVKSLEKLIDKSVSSINSFSEKDFDSEKEFDSDPHSETNRPIDLSMDVLDLSKKTTTISNSPLVEEKSDFDKPNEQQKIDISMIEKNQQLFLAQQQFLTETLPKMDPAHYFQLSQFYRNLVFPPINPFFLPNSFLQNNLNDLSKFPPNMLMNPMFGGPNDHQISPQMLSTIPSGNPAQTQSTSTKSIENSPQKQISNSTQLLQKTLTSSTPNQHNIQRHISNPVNSQPQLAPSSANTGPVKMVIKNGVLMPKQKQRRYRTERPFTCEHCSARFTLRSNMERHIKQQHPQYWAQRQRSGHHVMRRGHSANNSMPQVTSTTIPSSSSTPAMTTNHFNAISDQVKYAILAQQLKARKDTDNISPNNNQFNGTNPNNIVTGNLEDDEPKLVIDEEEDDEDNDEDNYDEDIKPEDLTKTSETKPAISMAKKVAETILEQAIKASSSIPSKQQNSSNENHETKDYGLKIANTMIARAESVGKYLKEVASSSFKEESTDLVPVAKLVDNATNSLSFNSYFRPSDMISHMEQSDEEGLVASGSASESNNSGTEDPQNPPNGPEQKKKSAYSLAPNRVSCPYCQRMFPWSSSLRRHILTHTGQKPFKCSHCPLLFTTKSNCDRHLLRKHGNVESAVSLYVPIDDIPDPVPTPKIPEEQQPDIPPTTIKTNPIPINLNIPNIKTEQIVSASDLPFKCHLCDNSFSERIQCLDHIKLNHSQDFALLLAKGAIDADADYNQMHSAEDDERNDGRGKYPDYANRKVICAFCMRRFWSTEDLRRHMRTHSGERPFQCEICLRKFTLKHSMLRHMKKHDGNRNTNQSNINNSGSDISDDEQTSNLILGHTLRNHKIQEILNKAETWRTNNLIRSEQKENIALQPFIKSEKDVGEENSDLIGNLLGISDQGILNKLLSSADEAAKLLGVEK